MQKEFARENIEKEEKYTIENQEDFMGSTMKDFLNGNLKKEDLQDVWAELKKYPDTTQGLIFILDLFFRNFNKNPPFIFKLCIFAKSLFLYYT